MICKQRFFLSSDQQAVQYCKQHSDTFIAIVWPLVQTKIHEIENLLEKNALLCYKKKMVFDPTLAFMLLKEAHQRIPTVRADLRKHYSWYFPNEEVTTQPARIYLLRAKNLEKILESKYAVRKLFKHLQYRSIHATDTHSETIFFAQLLFSTQQEAQ